MPKVSPPGTNCVAMLFCQFAQAKSLREISDGLAVTCGKLNHLGLSTAPAKSTLAYANAHRPHQLFVRTFSLKYWISATKRARVKRKSFVSRTSFSASIPLLLIFA